MVFALPQKKKPKCTSPNWPWGGALGPLNHLTQSIIGGRTGRSFVVSADPESATVPLATCKHSSRSASFPNDCRARAAAKKDKAARLPCPKEPLAQIDLVDANRTRKRRVTSARPFFNELLAILPANCRKCEQAGVQSPNGGAGMVSAWDGEAAPWNITQHSARVSSFICLTKKSATSARGINPDRHSCGLTRTRQVPVLGPLVSTAGLAITHSRLLLRMIHSCASLSK